MDKMVKNIAVNPDRVQELVEKGGLKPDLLRKKPRPFLSVLVLGLGCKIDAIDNEVADN